MIGDARFPAANNAVDGGGNGGVAGVIANRDCTAAADKAHRANNQGRVQIGVVHQRNVDSIPITDVAHNNGIGHEFTWVDAADLAQIRPERLFVRFYFRRSAHRRNGGGAVVGRIGIDAMCAIIGNGRRIGHQIDAHREGVDQRYGKVDCTLLTGGDIAKGEGTAATGVVIRRTEPAVGTAGGVEGCVDRHRFADHNAGHWACACVAIDQGVDQHIAGLGSNAAIIFDNDQIGLHTQVVAGVAAGQVDTIQRRQPTNACDCGRVTILTGGCNAAGGASEDSTRSETIRWQRKGGAGNGAGQQFIVHQGDVIDGDHAGVADDISPGDRIADDDMGAGR